MVWRWLMLVGVFTIAALPLLGPARQAGAQAATPREVIVLFDAPVGPPSTNAVAGGLRARNVARRLGIQPDFVYDSVVDGFAATVTPAQRDALERLPGVLITPNRTFRSSAQMLPTGVNRIDADRNPWAAINRRGPGINADIAILDGGIAPHPELTIAGGRSCVGSNPRAYGDRGGHGTHVAGTAAAADNSGGVVGVAPGARLWAVKVLNDNGVGSDATIICGLNYVFQNRAKIDVVNMSLGGFGMESTCADDPFHRAVCRLVNGAQIPVVVAAGNESLPVTGVVPANFDEAITVSAFADSDGRFGGDGSPTCFPNADDTFASFSNYGPGVDIAAPGDCIRSTWLGRRYAVLSGTSMASPHVAGALALYLSRFPNATAAQAEDWLLTQASVPQTAAQGFLGDADGDFEPVLYLGPLPAP